MNIIQNQIKRTLSKPCNIEYIQRLIKSNNFPHRTSLALHLCEHFKFKDVCEKSQTSGCLIAIRNLERKGHFILPIALKNPGCQSIKRLAEPLSPPDNIPATVGKIKGLELILVETEEQVRIWNELMINEHPNGVGPLVGRQLRYLIGSAHGWLGGLGFGAAALQLADRDKWIGWTAEQRQRYLHLVVNMSRFLIRPNLVHPVNEDFCL